MKMRFTLSAIIAIGLFFIATASTSSFAKSKAPFCPSKADWFPHPAAMPIEVAKSEDNGKSSNFCDFYQFSWHAFLYLMSPNTETPTKRNFQVEANYPILEISDDKKPVDSCDSLESGNRLFVTLNKSNGLPERIHQAGDGATIYDQNDNVVYYDVRFSKNMCDDAKTITTFNNFPTGTTEIKTAWKVIGKNDKKSDFLTMTTTIGSDTKETTLGLVGFHLAVATTDHPEFVWATYEHKNNDPDCGDAKTSADGSWSFTSDACTKALKDKDPLDIVQCEFNVANKQKSVTGSPTEICREYPYGTDSSDPNASENLKSVTSLNADVNKNLSGDMAILKKYFNVGDIWVSKPDLSSDISNQRGSLRLANTVAETTFQAVDINPKTNHGFASNCFGCHGFVGKKQTFNKNTTSGGLSHIFDDIAAGLGVCMDVQAGPIFSNSDAKQKCPSACSGSSSLYTWNNQWKTTVEGVMSVCGCCPIPK